MVEVALVVDRPGYYDVGFPVEQLGHPGVVPATVGQGPAVAIGIDGQVPRSASTRRSQPGKMEKAAWPSASALSCPARVRPHGGPRASDDGCGRWRRSVLGRCDCAGAARKMHKRICSEVAARTGSPALAGVRLIGDRPAARLDEIAGAPFSQAACPVFRMILTIFLVSCESGRDRREGREHDEGFAGAAVRGVRAGAA